MIPFLLIFSIYGLHVVIILGKSVVLSVSYLFWYIPNVPEQFFIKKIFI